MDDGGAQVAAREPSVAGMPRAVFLQLRLYRLTATIGKVSIAGKGPLRTLRRQRTILILS
jgi:hypothetical protein